LNTIVAQEKRSDWPGFPGECPATIHRSRARDAQLGALRLPGPRLALDSHINVARGVPGGPHLWWKPEYEPFEQPESSVVTGPATDD